MESKLEVVIAQFLRTKEKRKSETRGNTPLKIQNESRLKDGESQSIVTQEVEQSQFEDICFDHGTTNSEEVELLSEYSSPEKEVT